MSDIGDAAIDRSDIMRRLDEIERRIDAVAAGRRLENATISDGDLTIEGTGQFKVINDKGETVFAVGFVQNPSERVLSTLINTPDGKAIFWSNRAAGGLGDYGWALSDRLGNQIVGDNAITSDGGLVRPYIPIPPVRDQFSAVASSTSTDWESIWLYPFWKQHPCFHVQFLTFADSGTAGEWRLHDTDGTVLASGTITYNDNTWTDNNPPAFLITGKWSDYCAPYIDVRRTSGTGKLYVKALDAYGRGPTESTPGI